MTDLKRRTLLKGTLAGTTLALAGAAGLLKPLRAVAAEWPTGAFDAKSVDAALKDLYGADKATQSKDITIKAPIQAENGAVVPVTVSTTLPNVESIGILVEKNATPLAAKVSLSNGAAGYFAARLKMGQTSNVHAYVKSGGKLYMATQNIKVTVGGCGG